MTDTAEIIEDAQTRLKDAVFDSLEQERDTLIQAQTGMGKSHLIATTPWSDFPEITGGKPVVMLSMTKKARDEAVEKSRKAGIKKRVLEGREDACPVAAGNYDDTLTYEKLPASVWLKNQCDRKGVKFSTAHGHLEDQLGDLPCGGEESCKSRTQWEGLREGEDATADLDIIHATAQFAHTHLTDEANVIYDERPDYSTKIDQEQLRRATTELLSDVEGESRSLVWESLVLAIHPPNGEGPDDDALEPFRSLARELSDGDPDITNPDAHGLAPQIFKALVRAKPFITRVNGESTASAGRYGHFGVILTERNTVKKVYHRPDLEDARCVIGLDAHPSKARWEFETGVRFEPLSVFTDEENEDWRRKIRKLSVAQIGNDAYYWTRGWKRGQPEKVEALIKAIHRKHGEAFRTCICPRAIEPDVNQMMRKAGISEPKTITYGNERSRNDFADETVGLVLGCIDGGDDAVLGMVALMKGEAYPAKVVEDDGSYTRERNRVYDGPDADLAEELNESIRRGHVEQSVGRYARDVRDPNDHARVYVYTSVLSEGMVDEYLPKIRKLTENQELVERKLREADGPQSLRDLAELTGIKKPTLRHMTDRMCKEGVAQKVDEKGFSGAALFEYIGEERSYAVMLESGEKESDSSCASTRA